MALNANCVFEVRTGGNDTNGGGFRTGASGTDYSQQDAKNTVGNNISTTDAVANGTTTLTSATASFTSAIVGNVIYLQGGTGALAAGWYEVTGYTNATTITLDRTVATGTGITLNIGGAFASLGRVGSIGLVSGNKIWMQAGSYTITSASTNVSNGCFSLPTLVTVEGYQTTRGDLGTAPVLTASGITNFILISASDESSIRNLTVDGASLSSSRGYNLGRGFWYKLTARNCSNYGIVTASGSVVLCTATGCSDASREAIRCQTAFFCEAYDNTCPGFGAGANGSLLVNCLAHGNTGATVDGFVLNSAHNLLVNCVSYGSGRHGFAASAYGNACVNCLAEGNGGYGWNTTSTAVGRLRLFACGAYTNTSGAVLAGSTDIDLNFVTGSASFFVNPAADNFALNETAGGGASARGVGVPGTYPRGTVGYADLGAVQSQAGGAADVVGQLFRSSIFGGGV